MRALDIARNFMLLYVVSQIWVWTKTVSTHVIVDVCDSDCVHSDVRDFALYVILL